MLNVMVRMLKFKFYYRVEGVDYRLRVEEMRWSCESPEGERK